MAIGIVKTASGRGFRRGAERHHGVPRHPLRGAAGGRRSARLSTRRRRWGALRWARAPQPAPAWAGGARLHGVRRHVHPERRVRPAWTAFFAPPAERGLPVPEHLDAGETRAGEDLPVHFWIHGGGFQGGLGDEPLYQGVSLVEQGEILVTINYRLGALGFLAHPALTEEDGNRRRAAITACSTRSPRLRWVKKNIRAFGGDPNRITINGQSAGAMSVASLLASPLTQTACTARPSCRAAARAPGTRTKAEAEADGLALQNALGCASVEEMRALPAEAVLAATKPAPGRCAALSAGRGRRRPARRDPYDAFLAGRIGQVPVLIGSNADEGLFAPVNGETFAAFAADAKRLFRRGLRRVLRAVQFHRGEFPSVVARRAARFRVCEHPPRAVRAEPRAPLPGLPVLLYGSRSCCRTATFVGATHSAASCFTCSAPLDVLGGSTVEGDVLEVRKGPPAVPAFGADGALLGELRPPRRPERPRPA